MDTPRFPTVVAAAVALAAAGCVTPAFESEPAAGAGVVDLVRLVLGHEAAAAAAEGSRPYLFTSLDLDASWAAVRVPVPDGAVQTSALGRPSARLHVVAGFVGEDGALLDGERPESPRETDASGPILQFLGYSVLPDGRAVETLGNFSATLAPTYLNFTLFELQPGALEEVLLVVALHPDVDDPGPLHLALAMRVEEPGDEFRGARDPDQYREALVGIGAGRAGSQLVPVATGGDVGLALYEEFPPGPEGDAATVARNVEVEDEPGSAPTPFAATERRLLVRAALPVSGTSRVIGGLYHSAAAQHGEWSWSYASPSGEAFSGSGSFASASTPVYTRNAGQPPGIVLLRVEDAGVAVLEGEWRTTAAALAHPSLFLFTLGIDLEALLGAPVYTADPSWEQSIPDLPLATLDPLPLA